MAEKILIVGLGNPGPKYEDTRHNVGFMVLDKLARKILPLKETRWEFNQKFNSLLVVRPNLVLVEPQTFMNASGEAVAKLANFYQITHGKIMVVHDDVDLPLGKIKIRIGGASAGHHGVESIINRLGTDQFGRLRLGIGRPRLGVIRGSKDVENFVLEKFREGEAGELKKMLKKAVAALELMLEEDLTVVMNRFN